MSTTPTEEVKLSNDTFGVPKVWDSDLETMEPFATPSPPESVNPPSPSIQSGIHDTLLTIHDDGVQILHGEFADMRNSFTQQLVTAQGSFAEQLVTMEESFGTKVESLDTKVESLDTKFDTKFESLDTKFSIMQDNIKYLDTKFS